MIWYIWKAWIHARKIYFRAFEEDQNMNQFCLCSLIERGGSVHEERGERDQGASG